MKVLIVDDSESVRRLLERIMARFPFTEILTASTAGEALRIFQDVQPEFVTLDITLPELDGLTILSQILEINPKIKVLVISALADSATAIEALKRGANSFICKPFSPEEIMEVLSEILL